MTTQVIFKIDPKIKRAAIRKAKNEGITFSSMLKFATRAYVNDQLQVGLIYGTETPNAKTARLLNRIDKDTKAGRNLSGPYHTAEDFVSNLKKTSKDE